MRKGILEAIGILKDMEYDSPLGITFTAKDLNTEKEYEHYITKVKIEINEKENGDGNWLAQVDFLDLEKKSNGTFIFLDNRCFDFENDSNSLKVSYINVEENTLYTIAAS